MRTPEMTLCEIDRICSYASENFEYERGINLISALLEDDNATYCQRCETYHDPEKFCEVKE